MNSSFGVWGVAVAPSIGKVFWANANDSQIWSANLDGTGQTNLTSSIGSVSAPSDIDYDAGLNKIYWVEFNFNGTEGRLRRANINGSGSENLVSTDIPRARYLTIKSDNQTLPPTLVSPASSSLNGITLPINYTLPEAPLAGSVRISFVQGPTTLAELTMTI